MKKVIYFTLLLLFGLFLSQTYLPKALIEYNWLRDGISIVTLSGLSFIMFFVGLEFQLKKSSLGSYKTDYIVAFTAATFPWILSAIYLLITNFSYSEWFTMDAWKEVLFVGRFAAPTSAGILFTMLAAAGLASTWVYKKIKVLAIFDDLDTVLLLIPLKIMVMGFAWELGVVLIILLGLCIAGWKYYRAINLPLHGAYPLLYSALLAISCHGLYLITKKMGLSIPIHIEVLFPAFILGMVVTLNKTKEKHIHKQENLLTIAGGIFMMFVGLNMPYVLDQFQNYKLSDWSILGIHVVAITLLSNIGKLYVLFNYQDEASFKERLAVGVGMLPRGEVGAGVLVMAIGLGFQGRVLTIALASLVLNFILTGAFIYMVKYLTTNKNLEEEKLFSNRRKLIYAWE